MEMPVSRLPKIANTRSTLVFGTSEKQPVFRCHKPCSKPKWLLKVFEKIAQIVCGGIDRYTTA
jgi:hypothetical protein